MVSAAELRNEVLRRYPRMEGTPEYKAEVLADLNGVDEQEVRTLLIVYGLVKPEDFRYMPIPKTEKESLQRRRAVSYEVRPSRTFRWASAVPFYGRGFTDAEIGVLLGFSQGTVAKGRRRNGLPANKAV